MGAQSAQRSTELSWEEGGGVTVTTRRAGAGDEEVDGGSAVPSGRGRRYWYGEVWQVITTATILTAAEL